ncbi:pilus assembly protein PilM [Thiotrichales bacterium 19X7-9]|nr:pilus assembly protein PilM [Thiotrichales bacterium 19X7-9]
MNGWLNRSEAYVKNIASLIYDEFIGQSAQINTALEITDDQVHMLCMKRLRNGQYQLLNIDTANLTEPVFQADKIQNNAYLSSVILQLFSENSIKPGVMSLSLPVNRIISQSVQVDKHLEEGLLEEKVLQSIETYFSYQPSQIYYDYQIVHSLSDQKKDALLFVAAHRDIVAQYIDLSKLINMQLATLDVYHYALYRLIHQTLWSIKSSEKQPVILIDFKKSSVAVTLLIYNQIPTFCEMIPIVYEDDNLINAQLPWLKRTLNMAQSAVEGSINNLSIYLCGDVPTLADISLSLSSILDREVKLFNPFEYLMIQMEGSTVIENPYQYLIPLSLLLAKEV